MHGRIEILGETPLDVAEIPAHRWHRWTEGAEMQQAGHRGQAEAVRAIVTQKYVFLNCNAVFPHVLFIAVQQQ